MKISLPPPKEKKVKFSININASDLAEIEAYRDYVVNESGRDFSIDVIGFRLMEATMNADKGFAKYKKRREVEKKESPVLQTSDATQVIGDFS